MEKKSYQICQRCVMDTSDEDIIFDENGYCNHCTDFLQLLENHKYVEGQSEKIFKNILLKIKKRSKNNKYDCLVGISGGVDSCFVAHLCKTYGLHPLLMHMNNGWNTPIAEENIQIMVKKLGFDYYEYKMDWQEFKEIQLAFFKSSIVDLETPTDLAILGANYEIAKKFKISSILSGGNFAAEGILPLTWGYHVKSDMKLYRHIVKKYSNVKIRKTPYAGLKENFINKFIHGIKTYYPLNYIDYDKDKARKFLIETYGFKEYGGKHQESTITGFLQSYVMPVKYNMDYRRATLSSQICNGQVSRDDALRILEAKPFDDEKVLKDKAYICKKWEISEEEFDKYLKLPPKTYKDFPNQERLISRLFRLYKLFS
ncbi:MAG: N-acetyl sugar amidotransferase [Bacteroidales bacterium]|nr:N-acetyl sugar amidotransferase [Bacteroidales bacterium]